MSFLLHTAAQAPDVSAQPNGRAAAGNPAAAAPAAVGAGAAGPALQPAATHVQRDAPGEVAATSTEDDYLEYRETTDMREPYRQGEGSRRDPRKHRCAQVPAPLCHPCRTGAQGGAGRSGWLLKLGRKWPRPCASGSQAA